MKRPLVSLLVYFQALTLLVAVAIAQEPAPPTAEVRAPHRKHVSDAAVCASCIRAHEEFLASDAMLGRGSGTHDEFVAATYVGSQLRQYGIDPAGDGGGFIQRAATVRAKFTSAPTLIITPSGKSADQALSTWNYGKGFLVSYVSQANFSGPLQKIDANDASAKVKEGAVVLIRGNDEVKVRRAAIAAASSGAVAALALSSNPTPAHFEEAGRKLPELPSRLEGAPNQVLGGTFNMLALDENSFNSLTAIPEASEIRFEAPFTEEKGFTWNAIGILRGRDPELRKQAVLLSAHLDHLGVGPSVKGDDIYNGADDDASGTTAVLELARSLGRSPRPRRTVVFALFGSEETGGQGSTYFREHPPVPLKAIIANLEFEMLGRADPKMKADTVWLTGWERSNLGPTLAAQGARLVADPHPDQNFFARSDNFVLAKKGVIAQTISSYGLHSDYHQPSDDLSHLDFKHMTAAIASLLRPVNWLVNSSFTPQWNKGGQP